MFRKLLIVAALGLASAAMPARAGTLTYNGYNVLNAQTVTLVDPALNLNETGLAGQISLLSINGTASSLASWCIDVADWLQNNGTYTSGGTLTGTFASQFNALLTNVLPTLATNPLASAALQIAIWKVEYGSALTVTTNNSALDSLVSSYMTNVSNRTWTADPRMSVATLRAGGGNQDQAYLAPVPEPATLGVVGAGLLCLLGLHARRRRAGRAETARPIT